VLIIEVWDFWVCGAGAGAFGSLSSRTVIGLMAWFEVLRVLEKPEDILRSIFMPPPSDLGWLPLRGGLLLGEVGFSVVVEGLRDKPFPRLERRLLCDVDEAEVSGRGEGSGRSRVMDLRPVEENDERRGEVRRSFTTVIEERRSFLISFSFVDRRSCMLDCFGGETAF